MATPNWVNRTIFTGDNLDIMRGMNAETVDLIYLDPPFNSNKNYSAPVGSKAAGAAFKDTWTLSDLDVAWMGLIADQEPAIYKLLETAQLTHGKGMQSYLCMMAVRLLEMRRLLKDTGSIYLHCDPYASHYLKLLMDAVFGKSNYRNELVWCYTQGGRPKNDFPNKHDIILRYVKSRAFVFEPEAIKVSYELVSSKSSDSFTKLDEDGRYYKEVFGSDKKKKYRYYKDQGKVPYDWWTDIPQITGRAAASVDSESIGYPTQKPLALLERIIRASSNEGDVVLDPFAGCATACVAAETLDRQWVGIDLSPKAVELVNYRLQDTLGSLYHFGFVTSRKDIPQRTDIDAPIHYRQNKHVLYGQQEGICKGCKMDFPFKIFDVDHKTPKSRGGTDHIENLQLLCSSCNRIKGDRPMEYLMAQLANLANQDMVSVY